MNVYGDLSYSRVKGPFHGDAYAKISNSGNITENFFTAHRTDTVSNINARLGLDWQFNKKTVFGMLLNGYDNKYRQGEHNLNTLAVNGKTDTLIQLNNTEKNHWYNYAGNINLQHNFNDNDKLLLNLDYIHYNNNQPVNYHSGIACYFSAIYCNKMVEHAIQYDRDMAGSKCFVQRVKIGC